MTWHDKITRDPAICRGRATIKGTRILVSTVLDNLAAGEPLDRIVQSYPPLTPEDVSACLAYAAWLAHEDLIALPESASA